MFKKEYPLIEFGGIDWLVLEEKPGRQLLLSKNILFCAPFNNKIGPVNWTTCSLRSTLTERMASALSDSELNQIIPTDIVTSDNPLYPSNNRCRSTDKFFVLSLTEVLHYFGNDQSINQQSSFLYSDNYNSLRIAILPNSSVDWWWLRTLGEEQHIPWRHTLTAMGYEVPSNAEAKLGWNAVYVGNAGRINLCGSDLTDSYGGVRPAMWIKRQ